MKLKPENEQKINIFLPILMYFQKIPYNKQLKIYISLVVVVVVKVHMYYSEE